MPAQSLTLGTIDFPRKGDALAHLKAMLARYDVGDKVGGADAQVLNAALHRHPDATAKVGSGVSHFSVRSADFGTKCFWVNRTDGSSKKFSYRNCIYDKRLAKI